MLTRTRGYLPHIEAPKETYFVTFRLYDSLPQSVLVRYQKEFQLEKSPNISAPWIAFNHYEAKIEKYLDSSYGQCWLRDPKIARLIADAFRKQDGNWYDLHAYTIMPNHVHILFTLKGTKILCEIIRNWKGATSFFANQLLQRSRTFWQREYFERIVKSQRKFEYIIRYIFRNPVKPGLCNEVFEWPWTKASPEIEHLLKKFFV